MGNLTEDMSRLCGEIETLRDSRKVFGFQLDKETREMKTGVSKMRSVFRKDQNNMAVWTKADRVKFVKELDDDVNAMRRVNIAEHTKMANMTKADRKKFVNNLEDNVGAMRKANVSDLFGARLTWESLSAQGPKAKLMAERRAKAEHEMKLRMEAEQRAKALDEARAKAQAEKSKTYHEPSTEKKKDRK